MEFAVIDLQIYFQPTHMADFNQVQGIVTSASENDLKGVLKLKISGTSEPLTISCPSLAAADEMAELIDGYCRLVNSSKQSCWNRTGMCAIKLVLYILKVLIPIFT